ncbi:MAG: hypothetical protein QM667_07150 [Asticcacaulis sp.]
MPTKYRLSVYLDETYSILISRVFGAMPGDELCAEFIRAYQEIGSPWLYDRLIDLRRYSGYTSREDMERFAAVWAEWTLDVPEGRRVAFVTHDAVELDRNLSQQSLYPKDTLRAFDTADEALDWLTGQDEAVMPQARRA